MSVVYGVHPVLEYLRTEPGSIERIWVAEGNRGKAVELIWELAAKEGVKTERVDRARIARMAPEAVHQGVAAKVAEQRYVDPEDLLERAAGLGQPPFILALDQLQDPVHLGTALRSAYLLGAHGVLIPKDRAVGLTPAAVKASAGASAHLPVARAVNLSRTLEAFKREGIWIVGADMDGEPCDRAGLGGPICLVVGAEGKGLRHLTRERCDRLVSIPMVAPGVGSFSASASASILLYEVHRQRTSRAR